MKAIKVLIGAGFSLGCFLSSCTSDYSRDDFRQAGSRYTAIANPDLALCGTADCGRQEVLVTPDDNGSRFALNSSGTIMATPDTVSRLALTDNQVILTDQMYSPSSDMNRDINMALYTGMGEWIRLDAAETLAQRAATQLGYSSLTAMINDMVQNSGQPRYVVQNPTGDVFVDTLASYPEFVFGTSADGHRVVAGTCSTCHMNQAAKVQQDGSTRLVWEPFIFNGTVRAPSTYKFTVATLMSALSAGLATGPQPGDTPYVQALYVLGTQGYSDINSDKCGTWHCSPTDLQSMENIATPLYLLRRAYVWALYVDATASNIGAATTIMRPGGVDDTTLASLSAPYSRSDFDVGGPRSGIIDAVLKNQALTAIPEMPLRDLMLSNLDNQNPFGIPYNLDLSNYFSVPWSSSDNSANFMGSATIPGMMTPVAGYLFGATYARLPGISGFTVPLPTGWTTSTVISNLPRYAMTYQESTAIGDFFGMNVWDPTLVLPNQALCSMSNADVLTATRAYGSTCDECHAAPSVAEEIVESTTINAVVDPEAPVVIGGPGIPYAQNIENSIVTANNSTAVPSLMAINATNANLTPGALATAETNRIGPFGDPGALFAGWDSVTDFLNNNGGQAPAGWAVPSNVRSCIPQAPIATGNISSHDSLAALYREPELTGQVVHPSVPNLAYLTAAQKQVLGKFLVGPYTDRAYVDENGVTHVFVPIQQTANIACSAYMDQSDCEGSTAPACTWDGVTNACYGWNGGVASSAGTTSVSAPSGSTTGGTNVGGTTVGGTTGATSAGGATVGGATSGLTPGGATIGGAPGGLILGGKMTGIQ